MSPNPPLTKPWLIAVWPGMGHVAISAGYYLMAKLDMHLLAELSAEGLFDIEHIDVKDGVIQVGRLPRSRFFVWQDPDKQHDVVVFIGEAQPPLGKYLFCRRLIAYAKEIGVERVFTFAAMATQMEPDGASHVFCTATSEQLLDEIKRQELEALEEGRISGLNGTLLAAAAEAGLQGACLLGEMPHIFAQLPFPQASLAVLEAFTRIAKVSVDLEELRQQADEVGERLRELLTQVERNLARQEEEGEEEFGAISPQESLEPPDERRIQRLFEQAQDDRSKAYELKNELDRLGVFDEYEDRFLDLFKKQE